MSDSKYVLMGYESPLYGIQGYEVMSRDACDDYVIDVKTKVEYPYVGIMADCMNDVMVDSADEYLQNLKIKELTEQEHSTLKSLFSRKFYDKLLDQFCIGAFHCIYYTDK